MVIKEELWLPPSSVKHTSLHTDNESDGIFSGASAVLYRSKGEKQNLNCEYPRNNELVACLHLSHWWLAKDKFKYVDISSKELIQGCHDIPSNSELNEKFYNNRIPSEGVYFEVEAFPKVIYNMATALARGQEKRYLLGSSSHAMGFCIKKNQHHNIIIYYYDPNDTLRHRKIIAKTEDDLKILSSDDFWGHSNMQVYFPGMVKVGCLVSLDTKTLQEDCQVECIGGPSAELIILLSWYGHYGHPSALFDFKKLDKGMQKHIISAKAYDGTPILYTACQYGHIESAKALLRTISSIDLLPDEKKELLAGKRGIYGITALFMACCKGYYQVIEVLLEAISAIKFLPDVKKELFAGKRASGIPALYMACHEGHHEAVKAFIKKAVFVINLDLDIKKELLAGKSGDGTTALYVACHKGHHEVVKILLEAMCSCDLSLDMAEQEELMIGKGKDTSPALLVALRKAHAETVKVYLNVVLSSPLDSPAKERLLIANSTYGLPALQMAIYDDKMDVVNVFVEIVENSNALCASEKERLLKPYLSL